MVTSLHSAEKLPFRLNLNRLTSLTSRSEAREFRLHNFSKAACGLVTTPTCYLLKSTNTELRCPTCSIWLSESNSNGNLSSGVQKRENSFLCPETNVSYTEKSRVPPNGRRRGLQCSCKTVYSVILQPPAPATPSHRHPESSAGWYLWSLH